MVTRDDVPHDRRLPDSIVITVTEVDTRPKHPRDVELIATHENGDELHVIIWKAHNIDQKWVEGQDYDLDGARGKRYSKRTRTRVELHSTSAFQVREINQPESTQLLVMGDTYVGYRHRPRSENPSWAQSRRANTIWTRS